MTLFTAGSRASLTILGAPRTKKTHSRLVLAGGRHRILPSAVHERWFGAALPQARLAFRGALGFYAPISEPVNVRALFFRDADRGDAVGYYQALGDLLERAGVLENDRLISSWDGSRLLVDRERPRIEVVIEVAA